MIDQAYFDYARGALRVTLFLGYAFEPETIDLEVTEDLNGDGPNLLIKECSVEPTDGSFRIEARFYPRGTKENPAGRLHMYRLCINGEEQRLPPVVGVDVEFDGKGRDGAPELVDALVIV